MKTRQTSDRRRSNWIRLALALWLVACLGIAIDWATDYHGLVHWAGEWQFRWFGRYYPSATIILGVLIAVLPFAALWAAIRRRRRKRAEQRFDGAADASADSAAIAPSDRDRPLGRAIAAAMRANRIFGLLSVLLALSSFGALVIAGGAPTAEGPVRTIDPRDRMLAAEGHARFPRDAPTGRIARVYENVAFAQRTLWVAPVWAGRGAETTRYWTEVLPDQAGRFRRIGNGVFVHGGLPPEVAPLYRQIGVAVPDDAALLMRDADRPRWRMRALAVQTAVVSLLALAVALLLRRQARRLRTRAARSRHAAPVPV